MKPFISDIIFNYKFDRDHIEKIIQEIVEFFKDPQTQAKLRAKFNEKYPHSRAFPANPTESIKVKVTIPGA